MKLLSRAARHAPARGAASNTPGAPPTDDAPNTWRRAARRACAALWRWRSSIARGILAVVAIWALASRSRTRLVGGLVRPRRRDAGGHLDGDLVALGQSTAGAALRESTAGLAELQEATRRAYEVEDLTVNAGGGGVTVKYLITFDDGEKGLFKPLRENFVRVGRRGDKHIEEPLGEVVAWVLARLLRLRNVPPAVLLAVPASRLAASISPNSLTELLSRCPRYVDVGALPGAAAAAADCELKNDVREVVGSLVRWEDGLELVPRPARWYLAAQRAACAYAACPLRRSERRAWSDLEAFDAILGNYDRQNNIFVRRGRLAPIDHNHVLANLTRARRTRRSARTSSRADDCPPIRGASGLSDGDEARSQVALVRRVAERRRCAPCRAREPVSVELSRRRRHALRGAALRSYLRRAGARDRPVSTLPSTVRKAQRQRQRLRGAPRLGVVSAAAAATRWLTVTVQILCSCLR